MNHLKIETVDVGSNYTQEFAACDGLVSDLYVYHSLVCSACYHWWICLFVWFLSSIFLITFLFFYFNSLF